MQPTNTLSLPPDFDSRGWVQRWDMMQERYLVRRTERIRLMVSLTRESVRPLNRILDLGCGTGSLMQPFLEEFPQAEAYGLDFDPVLLPLAQARLRPYGTRAKLLLADLRTDSWAAQVPPGVDVVVSATALHWLTERELSALYRRTAHFDKRHQTCKLRPVGRLAK